MFMKDVLNEARTLLTESIYNKIFSNPFSCCCVLCIVLVFFVLPHSTLDLLLLISESDSVLLSF